MPDLHYEEPVLAELYDIDSGWSGDRDFYLHLADGAPRRVLDLGCGTGLLCDAYAARGHVVTGVDPARAMLDVARRRSMGDRVRWVEASAQTFRSPDRFDLIVMTGHAFQVLLTEEDLLAVLATIRTHLAAGGMAAFESRNPAIDWAARWNTDTVLHTAAGPVPQTRRVVAQDRQSITFETRYALPDRTLTSRSELLFLSLQEIEGLLARSSLRIRATFGDWLSQSFDPDRSEEIILLVEAA